MDNKQKAFVVNRLYQKWFKENRERIIDEIHKKFIESSGLEIDRIYIEEILEEFVEI